MLTKVRFEKAHGSYQGGEVAGLPDGEATALAATGVVTLLGQIEKQRSSCEHEMADDLFRRLGAEHHFRATLKGSTET